MPPTRALRSRTITNENDENLVTTRLTRAKSSALNADHHSAANTTLAKKPLQSKKAAPATGGNATGVNGATTTVMTRRRAALGDVSNMTKKNGSNSSLQSKKSNHNDENNIAAAINGMSEKEGKKTTTTTRAALASKTSVQSGGVQKLTRNNTTRSVLGAKDSNKRDTAAAEPAATARRGSGSGAMGDKKTRHTTSATGGKASTRRTAAAATHVLHDEVPTTAAAKKKAAEVERALKTEKIEKVISSEPVVEITNTTREKENVKPINGEKTSKKEEAAEIGAEKEDFANVDAAAAAAAEIDGESPEVAVDEVIDLDTEDLMDPLMAAEYVVEIFEHLKDLEIQTLPNPCYMDHQEEIDWKMRGILVDWLIEVHARFRLLPETLFLAVNIVDRFLSAEVVALSRLQLVGATAMFIASKYEEVLSPHVANFSQLADEAFSDKEILDAERHVLATLNYDISYPNPMNFLRRISKADNYDVHTRTIGKYLLEISLVDHRFMGFKQSHVAATAMYMARLMWNSGPWDATLAHYAGYTREEIWPVFRLMIDYLRRPPAHEAFFKKYASKKFMKASITVRKWAKAYYPIFLGEQGYETFMADIKTDDAVLQ
ncbi:G2/mitotic-specific cyclin [Ascosphaera aggregata]|nr:G2/mitotic-specific cyclin [Ascosphaera aggregata]